jgi:phage-related protein
VYRAIRPISWIRGARKDFEAFPQGARDDLLDALSAVAEGAIAKPLKGFGSGVLELALRHRKDAFRVVYALHIGADI